MKRNTIDFKQMTEHNRLINNDSKVLTGSIMGKHPVIMDGGKTTVFISDKSKESETRERYEMLKNNRMAILNKTHK
jgi:hypothetical protein